MVNKDEYNDSCYIAFPLQTKLQSYKQTPTTKSNTSPSVRDVLMYAASQGQDWGRQSPIAGQKDPYFSDFIS